jgi:hypothetical protein
MKHSYIPYNDVIYRLDGYVISDIDEATYPEFDLFHKESIIFHTLEEAEKKIAELVNENSEDRYCFFVREIPVGVDCYYSWAQQTRSYTRDGKLYAVSAVSEIEDENEVLQQFYGRDKGECHFQPGDFVEVFRGDRVTLEIVISSPVDRESFQKKCLASGRVIKLDFTDDGYTTLCGDDGYMQCHSHPSVVQCFPANSYFLDSKQRDKLLNGYRELVK